MKRRRFLQTTGRLALGGLALGAMDGLNVARGQTFTEESLRRVRLAADAVLPRKYQPLLPLHVPKTPPRQGDWLAQHAERAMNFRQYVASRPVRVDGRRRKLYVLPLGEFDKYQQRILDLSVEYMSLYFGIPVEKLDRMSLNAIPANARRVHPTWGDRQILSTYVLDNVLKPRLPADACSVLALTTSDLWPGEGWNFVFGQASYRERVGVWSIHRNGDPSSSRDDFFKCLSRTIKTATHETGHMFSITHCVYYECNMNGSNSLPEADRAPLALCPHCLAKLIYATHAEPKARYEKLAAFAKKCAMKEKEKFFNDSAAALAGK